MVMESFGETQSCSKFQWRHLPPDFISDNHRKKLPFLMTVVIMKINDASSLENLNVSNVRGEKWDRCIFLFALRGFANSDLIWNYIKLASFYPAA